MVFIAISENIYLQKFPAIRYIFCMFFMTSSLCVQNLISHQKVANDIKCANNIVTF